MYERCYSITKMRNLLLTINIRFDIVAYMMLLTIFYSITIPCILWWFNITIQPFFFPLAVLISIFHFSRYIISVKETIVFLFLLALSILINWIVPDMSWDGQAYHQPMVYALAKGWNPITDSHNPIIKSIWNMNIWIDHYLKGMEISAATIFSMTGQLETGKSVNMLFLWSVLMISMHIYRIGKLHISNFKLLIYYFSIACPMVFINYGLTFYIDVATYYLVFWIIIILYFISKKSKSMHVWYYLFIIVFLAACIKLNIFFWICYCLTIYCIYLLLRKDYQSFTYIIIVSATSIIFAIVTVNYNPIITNSIDHHNPIYPIGTKKANDIESNALPNLLKEKDRVSQVLISFCSRPNDNMETPYLNPYCLSYRFNIRSLGYGAKLGGGGLFFMEIVLISFTLLFLTRKNKNKLTISCITIIFLFALLILPFGSNYRYVPFISILPIILLLYTEEAGLINKFAYKLRALCLILLLLNNLVSIPFFLKNTYLSARSQKRAINYIRNNNSNNLYHSKNWSFNYKINGNQINDEGIFSDKNDNFIPISDQFGPPIYMCKEYFTRISSNSY